MVVVKPQPWSGVLMADPGVLKKEKEKTQHRSATKLIWNVRLDHECIRYLESSLAS